jgi:hypothetical protein
LPRLNAHMVEARSGRLVKPSVGPLR